MMAAIILAFLFSNVAGLLVAEDVKANPLYYKSSYEIISIQSPQNKTYNTNSLSLNFTSKTNLYPNMLVYHYTLDGNATILYGEISNKLLHVEQKVTNQIIESKDPFDLAYYYYYHPNTQYTIECNSVLPALSDGWHNITIYRGSNYHDGENLSIYYKPYSAAYFKIDTSNSMSENSSTLVIASVIPVAAVCVGLGLLIYGIKRKLS